MTRTTLTAALASLLALGFAAGAAALPYSSASGHRIQRQPRAGSCHARGRGLYALPDKRCTPGALNPAVRQSTIHRTICRSGWTSTVRPPESITEPEKYASLRAYGDGSKVWKYEYDHLVPLELGGAVNDPRNLWPEFDYAHPHGFYNHNPKDEVEWALRNKVCYGGMRLSTAQHLIATDWVAAWRRYG